MRRYDEGLLEKLYCCILERQRETGASPTYREIAHRLPRDFSSTAKISGYLKVLKNRGFIEMERNGRIAVDDRFQTNAISVPLVGVVACGQPIEAIENIEGSFALPADIFGSSDLMLLRADGQSMENVGIDTGDYIVIRKQPYAHYGKMVLAILEDGATVKTYYPQENGTIILHPENESYDDIAVRECENPRRGSRMH